MSALPLVVLILGLFAASAASAGTLAGLIVADRLAERRRRPQDPLQLSLESLMRELTA